MPGGLMSLLAVGAQDQYISISPEMSYFKQVYKRHTNFSMQSVRNTFLNKPTLDTSRASFTCKIARVGDLLGEIYLGFNLPNIYSNYSPSSNYQFRWIPNIANYMLYSYSVTIDTQVIDQKWGEWLDVWNELSLSSDKKYAYDRMTGNVEEFTSPKALKPLVILDNNKFAYSYYPVATEMRPSIYSKSLYVPLDFWFCKNPALALPLVALQYQTINVTIELRGIEDLYQLYDTITGKYYSPSGIRGLPHYNGENIGISAFSKYGGNGPSVIDLQAYLECNYIFMDTMERNTIASSSGIDYLIERVYWNNQTGIPANASKTIDLVIANPIKEFVWTLRRANANIYNDWGNYTAANPENPLITTMSSAKIIWNGAERFEEKPGIYFNVLQPYQYHTSCPKSGIYAYSFSLYPEKIQPSGSFNASMINKIQLYLTTNDNTDQTDYEISVYSIHYNIFRVIGGTGGMVFAL